jgi:dTDP-4-dehydrorhamnose 3,5-epimerase
MKNNLYSLITLSNKDQHSLIHDLVIKPLKVNRDPRGTLTEALKTTWEDVYNSNDLPFTQMYFSTTDPGVARDIDRWHYHPGGQQDRFGIISGDIIVALFDNRQNSPTFQTLNLFLMGKSQGDNGQYLLLIPSQTLHCYLVVSDKPATMINFPNRLYDPQEEQRIPFVDILLPDKQPFSWDKVKQSYSELPK